MNWSSESNMSEWETGLKWYLIFPDDSNIFLEIMYNYNYVVGKMCPMPYQTDEADALYVPKST